MSISKGVILMKALEVAGKLKEICWGLHLSYKYCLNVADSFNNPSYNIIREMLFLIPINFWFNKASNEFVDLISDNWLARRLKIKKECKSENNFIISSKGWSW